MSKKVPVGILTILRAVHICIALRSVTQPRLSLINQIRHHDIDPPYVKKGLKLNTPGSSGRPGSWQQYISIAYSILKEDTPWSDARGRMVEMANGIGRAAVQQGHLHTVPITHYHIPTLILTKEKALHLLRKSPNDAFMLSVMHIIDVVIQHERQNFLVPDVTIMCQSMVVKTVLARKLSPVDQVALYTKYPILFADLAPPKPNSLRMHSS